MKALPLIEVKEVSYEEFIEKYNLQRSIFFRFMDFFASKLAQRILLANSEEKKT